MKLVFLDPIPWNYTVRTVHERPLGGGQSALCYLAEALAARGHEVTLLTNTDQPGLHHGVACRSIASTSPEAAHNLAADVCVVLNAALSPANLRDLFGGHPLLVFWTGHATDEPAVRSFQDPAACRGYDYFVFKSDWQRSQFLARFPIPPEVAVILHNAVAPAFEGLFPPGTAIRATKARPPVLAYTSTPFRGLSLLLDMFPQIREAVPGTRLRVWSSMQVYQVPIEADRQHFGALYRACQQMEGVEYFGSIAQDRLALELRSVTALAYPNTFAETSCIAVMEAMAVGCGILTSQQGALPETTAGFGTLISLADGPAAYKERFRDAAIALLRRHLDDSDGDLEQHLRRQVDYVQARYVWTQRAAEWEHWLGHRIRESP